MEENSILPYVEPIFRFCCKRLGNRYDAEDLSGEIICHILEGMEKYEVKSLDAWVWRIAHNRYARFIDARNKTRMILAEEASFEIADSAGGYRDEKAAEDKFEPVFRYLHTISREYRDIFIDYYIGEMSIRELSRTYSLPETTIKWRLNVGRQKIRERIGEDRMDRVYKRINWNTTCCNGSMDSDQYLHTQISRAICQAAYEKPLTVEEISIRTGIPAMYIEDELPRLVYGDAVCKTGNKYATNFIIFRLQDRKNTEGVSEALVKEIANKCEALLRDGAAAVETMDFYGHDFGMERLGYLLLPFILRRKIGTLKSKRLKLENGPFPPRQDGGYGWFIVEETMDERENSASTNAGCNVAGDDDGSGNALPSHIYYYWIARYFDQGIYHHGGIRWLYANGIPQGSRDGCIEKGVLSDEDAARLIQKNLLVKSGEAYKLNFACFTQEQFTGFRSLFDIEDARLDDLLADWIVAVRKSFGWFVPARLAEQINQWVSGYLFQIVGYVVEELIGRGVLRKPAADKPLTDGVFYVEGRYIDP